MKNAKISVLLILSLTILAFAQSLPTVQPEKVGMSSERLRRIDEVFQKHVDQDIIPGAVALVMRKGKIVHFKAYGVSDIDTKRALQKDDLFRIASMTKSITSVGLMTLYEEGAFLLDDDLADYIPGFKNPKVLVTDGAEHYTIPARGQIKIRHILNHTAGFIYQSDDPLGRMYGDAGITDGLCLDPLTIEETVRRMTELPLLFNPGEAYHYSMAVDVQGRLIEVLSGLPLDRFLQERVLKPLGMRDTHFFLPQDKIDRLVAVHVVKNSKVEGISERQYGEAPSIHTTDYPFNGPKVHLSGGAGLSSTAEDYARFCQMLLNGGELNGKRILSRKTVEMMTTNTIGDLVIDSQNNKFGLGFSVRAILGNDELGSVGAYGWGGYWHTQFLIDPAEEMIIIHMSNLRPGHGTVLDKKLRVLAYQAVID